MVAYVACGINQRQIAVLHKSYKGGTGQSGQEASGPPVFGTEGARQPFLKTWLAGAGRVQLDGMAQQMLGLSRKCA